ncbi:MAG: hypothetical protein OER90_21150 [Gemmatimonadota bacterium]|nr:hypothetical protein [Gemmatimonadota bacterium]
MRELCVGVLVVCVAASCGGERRQEEAPPGGTSDTLPPVTAAAPDTTTPSLPAAAAPPVAAAPVRDPRSGDTTVTGVVRAVGAIPLTQTVVQTASGEVALVGPYRDELSRVIGAEVRVWGKALANAPPAPSRAVEVSAYEVVQLNGQRPVVGTLAEREDSHFIEVSRTEIVRLAALPRELTTLVGRRVWVFGERGPNGLRVQVFGEVRPPNE